jgi:hypothetical protein
MLSAFIYLFFDNFMCLKLKLLNPKNDVFHYNPALQANFAEDGA